MLVCVVPTNFVRDQLHSSICLNVGAWRFNQMKRCRGERWQSGDESQHSAGPIAYMRAYVFMYTCINVHVYMCVHAYITNRK